MVRIGDLHCDTPSKIFYKNTNLTDEKTDWSLNKVKGYEKIIQTFAVCIEEEFPGNPFTQCENIIKNFKEQLNKHNIPVMKDKFTQGKINAILALEGGVCLEGSIENIEKFYNMGVRIITLTWNYENELGFGAVTGSKQGLKEFGKKAIREMNRLKIATDVSHLNEAGFFDALYLSEIPVIASHSNSRKICDNLRNLTDEQFTALTEKGGVVGINSYPLFLNNTPKAGIKDIIKHIEHFMSLGGENNICLGCDFDGIDYKTENLEDAGCYFNLINELAKLNYSEEKIAKITYKNLNNYLKTYIFEFF